MEQHMKYMDMKPNMKTPKEGMIAKIFGQVVKQDKSAKHAKMFYNLDGDWVIQYQQGRQKYLVMIEEL